MPIFEYSCNACRKVFEHLSYKTEGDGPKFCSFCGSKSFQRVLSPMHIVMGDEWSSLRKQTGCKGFEVSYDGGKTKLPMWNKNKLD